MDSSQEETVGEGKTEMETYAQHSIRHCMDMIAPFEMSKGHEEDGQLQFYQFMTALYHDMYQRPEEYMVFPKPYEEYMEKLNRFVAGRTMNVKQLSNASQLRGNFDRAALFYQPPAKRKKG